MTKLIVELIQVHQNSSLHTVCIDISLEKILKTPLKSQLSAKCFKFSFWLKFEIGSHVLFYILKQNYINNVFFGLP